MTREEIMRAVLGLKPGQEARVYDGSQPIIEVPGYQPKPIEEPEWEAPEPECDCVYVDVDRVDNSSCQVHGVRF